MTESNAEIQTPNCVLYDSVASSLSARSTRHHMGHPRQRASCQETVFQIKHTPPVCKKY